jgi:hypothetical protein
MKSLLILMGALMTLNVHASETVKITTPRGAGVTVTMHIPPGAHLPILVVAPGQSCNSKGFLFEALGDQGLKRHYAVFRFEWSYCETSNKTPSAGLRNELEDMAAVLEFAKKHAAVEDSNIVIAGKSMGSGVAYKIFSQRPELKALVLLTPLCSETTDENDKPLPKPLSVCEKNYPHLKEDRRPILMTMGNKDEACVLPVLFDYLKDSKGNVQTFVAGGDHGFRIFDVTGAVDPVKTQTNIETVVGVTLNWMDLTSFRNWKR